ncbi:MAG: YkgB family protein [Gemmatimonadales bacterium]
MATGRVEHMERGGSMERGRALENLGEKVLRYGLVAVLLWVGALKFTEYEAMGIKPLVENSPLTAWALQALGLKTLSALIGTVEIVLGLMIATRSFAPKVSAYGSMGAIVMFLITLTFVLTTPGVWQPGYGFPFPSPMPGQFLAKDIVLLGVAIWSAGEALRAAR